MVLTAFETFDKEGAVPIGFLTDLFATTTLEDVHQTYAQWCRRITGSERSAIGVPFDTEQMIVSSVSSAQPRFVGRKYSMSGSTLGQTFTSRRTMLLDDLANQPCPGCRRIATLGMTSLLLVPILSGDRCFGVITTGYRESLDDVAPRRATLEVIAACLATHMLLIEKMDELRQLSETDPLTGALNRHRMQQIADRLWTDWTRIGRPFTLATFDLDHFKLVNDQMGHAVGDTVLKEIAQRLRKGCRSGDHVVRLGGEEFCVLLSGVSAGIAEPLVDRLTREIRSVPVNTTDGLVAVTTSVGVASARYEDESFEDCLKRSDDALYMAKSAGRDRIEVWSDA